MFNKLIGNKTWVELGAMLLLAFICLFLVASLIRGCVMPGPSVFVGYVRR